MLALVITWLLLATASGVALGRFLHDVDAQDPDGSWADFCAAHGFDEIPIPAVLR